MTKKYNTLNDNLKEVRRLSDENGGKLPSRSWLVANGYSRICSAMSSHPEAFDGIKQERILDKNVEDAKRLANENGGKLPRNSWLAANGYSRICTAMYNHPDAFDGIEQELSIDERVEDAKRLANENGGKLPSVTWLIANGYRNICSAMYNHPDDFTDIAQSKEDRILIKNVEDAKRLANENGGKLPRRSWLVANGYNRICSAMSSHPEAFSGIKIRSALDINVEDAERLAVENGGKLPNGSWLSANGFERIRIAKHRHPEAFFKH